MKKRRKASEIQKEMLKINKEKPSTEEISNLFDILEKEGLTEKKSDQPKKKIATPPEANA